MKINKTLCKIIISLMVILICCSTICYATGLPNLGDPNYRPTVQLEGTPKTIIATILGVLQAIGGILIVISIALIGFNTIMGSASEKAIAKEKFVGLFIAAVVILGGSTLAKMIASVAESL